MKRRENKSVGVSFSQSILVDTSLSSDQQHNEHVFRKEKSMPNLKN